MVSVLKCVVGVIVVVVRAIVALAGPLVTPKNGIKKAPIKRPNKSSVSVEKCPFLKVGAVAKSVVLKAPMVLRCAIFLLLKTPILCLCCIIEEEGVRDFFGSFSVDFWFLIF